MHFRHTSAAAPPATPTAYTTPNNGFDANVVMVLSVLLCALVCSLGLNVIVRCALRCSSFVARESTPRDDNHHIRSTRLSNTGIKKKALKTFPTVNYSIDLKMPGLDSECVICLSEFAPGERLRILPKCNHGFHVRCIDKWLNSHSSCPTCRHCLIETCQKILGCERASDDSRPPIPPRETVIDIAPLEREDMIHN